MNRRAFIQTAAGVFVPTAFAIGQGLSLRNPAYVSSFKRAAAGGGGSSTDWLAAPTDGSASAYDGFRGTKFTVGGAGITITRVGGYLSSADGYDPNTPWQLRASDGTTVLNSGVIDFSVNIVGWVWSSAVSISLSASTVYYLGIDANSQSLRISFTPSATGAATVNDTFYDGGSSWLDGGEPGKASSVNFSYT